MKKYYFLLMLLTLYFNVNFSQNVNIPDTAFKTLLINHTPIIDLNSDNQISISEAQNFTDSIIMPSGFLGGTIYDLTGLEAFINITGLNLQNMGVTHIDLTANTKLKYVYLGDNFILDSNIDMSVHDSLTYFSIENTRVKAVDLSNGNNINITICDLSSTQLNCVTVDDVTYSTNAPN